MAQRMARRNRVVSPCDRVATGELLRSLFDAALAAADPARAIAPYLPRPVAGRTVVVGAGKASAAMARAVEKQGPGQLEGLVVTRHGHGAIFDRIEIAQAGH